jgi:hypothetical protein
MTSYRFLPLIAVSALGLLGLVTGCPSASDAVPEPSPSSSACEPDCGAPVPTVPPTASSAPTCEPDCPPPPPAGAEGTLVLGNPTRDSVTVSIATKATLELFFEYGAAGSTYAAKSEVVRAEPDVPVSVVLGGLAADGAQHYRVRYRSPGAVSFETGAEKTFRTARATGKTFTFTVQADSHRDENSNLDLYRRALDNVRADAPDFHVDLGDTFMTEKYAKTDAEVVDRYLEERSYFARATDVVPLFLVNGNHEGEVGWGLDGTDANLAVWATKARLTYFVNPLPNGFYSGDATSYPFVGKRGGYYAWQWGDALFVTLDPFWFTKDKPRKGGDGWGWTLGDAQYHWLENVLQTSTAKYKFVFSHHMVGGFDDARGGIEAADLWEWGGKGASGADELAARRPGWAKPIHRLMVDTKVTAWFHGHDHLYCKQDKDGIVYQEVPQPSHLGENAATTASAGGYVAGTIVSSSGHLRVTVAPDKATVDYVLAVLPANETPAVKNAKVADTYTMVPR